MAETITCSCGEPLPLPPSYTGGELLCPRCRKYAAIPGWKIREKRFAAPHGAPQTPACKPPLDPATAEISEPAHSQLIDGAGGRKFWKLTCPCGKRLLTPELTHQPYGHCPKCGRHLPMPGYHAGPASAAHEAVRAEAVLAGELDAGADDGRATEIVAVPDGSREAKIQLCASATAADRLRPSRREHTLRASSGRVSAWPLAGRGRRLLAAFIDFSLAGSLSAAVVLLTGVHALEPLVPPLCFVLGLLFLILIFNDTAVHVLLGGSIGKHLVVLDIRTEDGALCGAGRLLARALLKWVFIPGWLIGALDSAERTGHDLLAGTLVLKGRPRRNP